MDYIVKILDITDVTHNVKRFKIEKPEDYSFTPGQATDVSINKKGWDAELRPFTFTSLNNYPYLEFTIKRYKDHDGVTNHIHGLKKGDELIIRDVWGAIAYKGPGYFIAGGAGITPFIAILRQLHMENNLHGNTLLFANRTAADIIYNDELRSMLGNHFINILSDEKPQSPQKDNVHYGHIDEAFLAKTIPDFNTNFYVCGPDPMIHSINHMLAKHGAKADNVVFEK